MADRKGSSRKRGSPKDATRGLFDSSRTSGHTPWWDADYASSKGDTYVTRTSGSFEPSNGVYVPIVRCTDSHPPLPLGEFKIWGGSCTHPTVTDADVYIGFDFGMEHTRRGYPWNPGEEVYFRIRDMSVPSDVAEFAKLVAWTWEQLQAGKKVHAGCVGGHGRTGTFLAALVKHAIGEDDAISYVRKNYCPKAVESLEQATWLQKHWGIVPQAGHKDSRRDQPASLKPRKLDKVKPPVDRDLSRKVFGDGPKEYSVTPASVLGSIWHKKP